jgi:hypothetical protein
MYKYVNFTSTLNHEYANVFFVSSNEPTLPKTQEYDRLDRAKFKYGIERRQQVTRCKIKQVESVQGQ